MFDIHTHILPFIDDGSPSVEESLKMIEKEIKIGVSNIIVTPHIYRSDVKPYTKESLLFQFLEFQKIVKEKNIKIELHLGQEVAYNHKTLKGLKDNEIYSLNDTNYVLVELPFDEPISDFYDLVYNFKVMNKKIVLAHIERYDFYKIKEILILKEYGVLLQANSNSITGLSGSKIQKKVMQLLKANAIDFIASDIHSFRHNDLDKAFDIVKTKTNLEIANKLFNDNAKKLLF